MSSEVYVVFSDDDGHWWSRFLQPFCRHCYVVIPDRGRWIVYGKTVGSLDIFTVDDKPFTLDDVIVIKAKRKECKRSPIMLNTCVGHVKQILGINNPLILTPYQLYVRLLHEKA